MDREQLIAAVSRATGVRLDPADPVLAAATINEVLLHLALAEFDRQTKMQTDRMVAAWANFAHTGNPNGKGDAPWPRWKKGGDTQAYLLQNAGWKTVQTNAQFAAAHQCSFWQPMLLYK